MRNIFYIVPVVVLFLASCVSNSPESVTKIFYAALKENNIEKMKLASATASHDKLDYAIDGASFVIGKGNLTKVECVTIDNEQECDCWFEGKDAPISTVLIKENEEWKVDVNSTFQKMAGNGILDLLKGKSSVGGMLLDALSGDGNVNKLVEEFSDKVSEGTMDINKLLEGIDPDDIAKSINGIDTSLSKTIKLLEEKGIDVNEAIKELKENQKK